MNDINVVKQPGNQALHVEVLAASDLQYTTILHVDTISMATSGNLIANSWIAPPPMFHLTLTFIAILVQASASYHTEAQIITTEWCLPSISYN